MDIDIGELLDRCNFAYTSDEEKEQFLEYFYFKNYSESDVPPLLTLMREEWRSWNQELEDLVAVTLTHLIQQDKHL